METKLKDRFSIAPSRMVVYVFLLFVVLGLLALAFKEFYVTRVFQIPIGYSMADDFLYVLEKADNTILKLDRFVPGDPMRLLDIYSIEPDDDRHYYMARKLYPGHRGMVVQSYIYDKKTTAFLGYRFREYIDFDEKPREILSIFLEDPETFPEFSYTVDEEGDDYFLNNQNGQYNIWKLRSGVSGVIITDGDVPPSVNELGEKNDSFSSWGSLSVDTQGTMYAASHSSGKIVQYAANGRRMRSYGNVGFEPGELLAPDDVMFLGRPITSNQPLLTVASEGNRTWVQFNKRGEAVHTIAPLERGYPFADILIGQIYICDHATKAYSFDLVNKAFIILGPEMVVLTTYEVKQTLQSLALVGVALFVLIWIILGWRRRIRRHYVFPLFLKLLVLFIPLLVISALFEGDWIRDVMKEELQEAYMRRSANLARAIINSVSVEDLEQIQAPGDRKSVAYERIYETVNRIVDTRNVEKTPKWIIHKIRDGRYYFGISIWRGPLYEPFIVPADRKMFFDVLKNKAPTHGRFEDEQGDWFSYLYPVTNAQGEVINVIELYRPSEGLKRIDKRITKQVGQIIGITVLAVIPIILLFSLISTRPLHRLMLGIQRLSQGDFDYRIQVRSHDETAALAHAFNRMIVDLQKYTHDLAHATAEKKKIETELRFARDMQQDVLPTRFPPFKGAENIEIYARMEPAREVGGDYYDFFMLDEEHMAVAIADVSGKGISAGLFMMVVRTLLRSNAMHNRDPGQAITKVNALLAEDNPACMFATLFYFVCNIKTGKVHYCNAGHNPPIVLREGKAGLLPIKKGKAQGMATGVLETAQYQTQELQLAAGERIILYTDGMTEPVDRCEEMFGEERVLEIINNHAHASNQEICDLIYDAVNAFQDGLEQFDDMTMLFFRFNEFQSAEIYEKLVEN